MAHQIGLCVCRHLLRFVWCKWMSSIWRHRWRRRRVYFTNWWDILYYFVRVSSTITVIVYTFHFPLLAKWIFTIPPILESMKYGLRKIFRLYVYEKRLPHEKCSKSQLFEEVLCIQTFLFLLSNSYNNTPKNVSFLKLLCCS